MEVGVGCGGGCDGGGVECGGGGEVGAVGGWLLGSVLGRCEGSVNIYMIYLTVS